MIAREQLCLMLISDTAEIFLHQAMLLGPVLFDRSLAFHCLIVYHLFNLSAWMGLQAKCVCLRVFYACLRSCILGCIYQPVHIKRPEVITRGLLLS